METYTIIYQEFYNVGSHHITTVCKKYIELDQGGELTASYDLAGKHGVEWSQVNFIFKGRVEEC